MMYIGIFLWCISRLIALSVAISIGAQGDDYTLCINADSHLICSTNPQAEEEIPNPGYYGLDFVGNNCNKHEEVCYYKLEFPKGTSVAWYRKNGCFYAEKKDPDNKSIVCVSKEDCIGKKTLQNPYFMIQDTQANIRLPPTGSNFNPKCFPPYGPYLNQDNKNPKGQDPSPQQNQQEQISRPGEEAQNIQPLDNSNPKSVAYANLQPTSNDEKSMTGITQTSSEQTKIDNTDIETEQLQAANVAAGEDLFESDDTLQKRREDGTWKHFTA